jgi:uncharacterized protein (TIGR00725 family)
MDRPHPSQVPYVAVVGPSDAASDEVEAARAVGAELARRGAVVVCGGRGGVMEAAARGAREGGGTAVGILPGPERAEANAYVDLAIATGMGELRNGLIVRTVDAVIAIGGAYGTLSEIALALKIGKPVVGLKTWELARAGRADDSIAAASGPVEAVDMALARASAPV